MRRLTLLLLLLPGLAFGQTPSEKRAEVDQLLEALKKGEIDALIVQDPFEMGYRSMLAAISKLKGGNPEHIQNIAPTLVTRENMDTPEIQAKINPDLKKYLEAEKK